MKTKLFTLLFAVAVSVTNLFAASVVLPATLDVTNVSFRSEDMPDFVIEDGTYLDMGAHDSANDTLLYAEWDVTIQSIKYDVAVNVYNTNSWSVQLYVLNMVGDTVKDLRYKGTSGMKGRVAIGSWDLSDLEAGNYKVRVHAATAWSAMKLKEVIFDGTVASGTCGAEGDNLTWELSVDGVLTISGNGAMADFVYNGSPWYTQRESIKTVIVDSGVTSIGKYALNEHTSLATLTIANSVTSIGDYAFQACTSLTSITIPDGVTNIGDAAFYRCTSLTNVTISNSVTNIGRLAFYACKIQNMTVPNGVTSIGNNAFDYCSSLKSCTISRSVTSIGKSIFSQCSDLTSIIVDSENPVYDSRDNCNAIIETSTNTIIAACENTFIPNSITCIGNQAFNNCLDLASVTIPNSIISIEDGAFYGCIKLKSLTIPSSVTSIGSRAFGNCQELESIIVESENPMYDSRNNCNAIIATSSNTLLAGCINTHIPKSVTSIGAHAFIYCRNLTNITIPNSITSIGVWAFYGCSRLARITCEINSPFTYGTDAFCEVDKSIPLYVPSGSIAAYQAADGWREFTNIQAIPEAPSFPGDPGTITYKLQLGAAVIGGDSLPDYTPAGAGGYAVGTSVTITAQDIPGYQFVQWSDSVTDKSRSIVIEQSTSLTAYYNRSQIEIAVAANAWTFFCLPAVGKEYTEEMFEYVGLTNVKWGRYNGGTRASGKSGWETPESFNAQQGYIIYSTTAGTLRINAYETDLPSGDVSVSIVDYSSSQPENAGWNFLGNPYSQGYIIAGLAAAGIESPITVWNGTGYDTYTPGIDTYILQPFEAFFIQKAEGGAESVTFNPEYTEGYERPSVEGELSGAFSVSATTKVHFSRGNLQYQASTATWRFAPNQYDMIGEDNANISDSYSGWIDLFGWGTGNNPTNTSKDDNDYSTFVDWGANAITYGGNEANLWRTLTTDEWVYLFYTRANAATLFGLGSVNGVNGTIILPDNWSLPVGASFTASTTQGLADQSNYYHNDNKNNFSHNTYTIEQWAVMESAGALFMPAAGYRYGTDVGYIDMDGNYWSATPNDSDKALSIGFDSTNLDSHCTYYRSYGRSVRLVR